MNTLKYDKNETYICQTDARVKYLLTLKDLKNIPYVARRALNYYSKSKIYLYRLKDIEDKSKDKYGGNFETVKKQKEELRKMKEKQKENEKFDRKLKLTYELDKRGLELRDDSKLCDIFIEKGIEHVHEICKEIDSLSDLIDMVEKMEFYYKHTNYSLLMKKQIKGVREQFIINDIIDSCKCDALYGFLLANKDKPVDELKGIIPESLWHECGFDDDTNLLSNSETDDDTSDTD
jgi:hypothetical protein